MILPRILIACFCVLLCLPAMPRRLFAQDYNHLHDPWPESRIDSPRLKKHRNKEWVPGRSFESVPFTTNGSWGSNEVNPNTYTLRGAPYTGPARGQLPVEGTGSTPMGFRGSFRNGLRHGLWTFWGLGGKWQPSIQDTIFISYEEYNGAYSVILDKTRYLDELDNGYGYERKSGDTLLQQKAVRWDLYRETTVTIYLSTPDTTISVRYVYPYESGDRGLLTELMTGTLDYRAHVRGGRQHLEYYSGPIDATGNQARLAIRYNHDMTGIRKLELSSINRRDKPIIYMPVDTLTIQPVLFFSEASGGRPLRLQLDWASIQATARQAPAMNWLDHIISRSAGGRMFLEKRRQMIR